MRENTHNRRLKRVVFLLFKVYFAYVAQGLRLCKPLASVVFSQTSWLLSKPILPQGALFNFLDFRLAKPLGG